MTRLSKLVDKICKYEMDLTSIVEDTERTQFGLQTEGLMYWQMDGQTDGQSETSIHPSTLLAAGTIVCKLSPQVKNHKTSVTDYKSTLVQVIAQCRQATSHNLSQCWPRSMSPYGITTPQWVNIIPADDLVMQETRPLQSTALDITWNKYYWHKTLKH